MENESKEDLLKTIARLKRTIREKDLFIDCLHDEVNELFNDLQFALLEIDQLEGIDMTTPYYQ